MAEDRVQITIVDDSKGRRCEVDCGLDWLSEEVISLAGQQVKGRFGDKIHLEYIDLSKSGANRRAIELERQVRDNNLPLPLLLVNGKNRISGQFDIRMLLDAIDAEMEIMLHRGSSLI